MSNILKIENPSKLFQILILSRSDESKSFLELNFESIKRLKRLSRSKIDNLAGGVIFIHPPGTPNSNLVGGPRPRIFQLLGGKIAPQISNIGGEARF